MQINNREISSNEPPYIIAEMSNNHLKDLNKAKKIIDAAKECGVDAIKIQTYTPDSLTIDCNKEDFVITDKLWAGRTYYDLYKEIAMPIEWTAELFEHARQQELTIFSSPFDEASVDLLEQLGAPAYKIASFEANDFHLRRRIIATGKPVIMSTGVSTYSQLSAFIAEFPDHASLTLLHCLSAYPSSAKDMNLRCIHQLQKLGCAVGLSDHSRSPLAAIASVAMGAVMIEKHFTISRADGGPDAAFSLEPNEMKQLVQYSKEAWQALGSSEVLNNPNRSGSNHRRSIYAVKDIKKGQSLSEENIRIIRPGFGMPPELFNQVIGKNARVDITRGSRLSWDLLENGESHDE